MFRLDYWTCSTLSLEYNSNFRTSLALSIIPSNKAVVIYIPSLWLKRIFVYWDQLRWLLDVASTNEPTWSEERAGVAKPVSVNARQLGGVGVVRGVTVRVTRVWRRRRRACQNCSDGPGVGEGRVTWW
jgi:hypothetical protein